MEKLLSLFPCLGDLENPPNVLGIPRNRGAPALRDCACALPARVCGYMGAPGRGQGQARGAHRRIPESGPLAPEGTHTHTHLQRRGLGDVTPQHPSTRPEKTPSDKFTHLLSRTPSASCSGSWHKGGKMLVASHSKQR